MYPSKKSIQKNIDYKRKEKEKHKRGRRGKEEPYPKGNIPHLLVHTTSFPLISTSLMLQS